ncbi:hypothetical protein COO60DRAFT_1296641 [Scenedesmus sp. NREL 46B-D3]|nr:hypothetical protein COO60DRAFT_1296641 [Scenedesmus sp. NREL 46B-D3]
MSPKAELAAEPVHRGKLLWTWEATVNMGVVMGRFPTRMCIAGYPLGDDGVGLVVVSPLEPTEAVVRWLQEAGQVCFIVAPNKHHTWWAAAMKATFPAALLVAPLGLAQQHQRLPVDVRITPLAGVQDMPGAWPAAVLDVIPIQGLPFFDELALHHKPSSTLILTDMAFNFDEACLAALTPRLALRAYLSWAAQRPCCMTKPFRWLIKDAAAVKGGFDQILATCEFDQVSMAHGSFISSGGKQAFLQGSYAFVDQLVKGQQAAGAEEGSRTLAGTGAALFVAAAVICTAVGIGVAGILQVWQQ